MTHKNWAQSKTYDKPEDTFEALVMAAMRKESLTNRLLLRRTFPMLAKEIDERSWLPDGYYGREVRDEDLTPASNDDTDPFAERQADRDNAPPAGTGQRREDQLGYR